LLHTFGRFGVLLVVVRGRGGVIVQNSVSVVFGEDRLFNGSVLGSG